MRFPLSDAELARLLDELPVGGVPPFDARPPADLASPEYAAWQSRGAAFVERVVADLVAPPDVASHRDLDACAWSSYAAVHLSFARPPMRRAARSGGQRSVVHEGVVVWLCRFAPAAAYSAGTHVETYEGRAWRGTQRASIDPRRAYDLPDGTDYEQLKRHVEDTLARHGVALVPREELNRPLPFDARIDTNVRPAPFTVFDALFRWND